MWIELGVELEPRLCTSTWLLMTLHSGRRIDRLFRLNNIRKLKKS